jgi:hypothetical protein
MSIIIAGGQDSARRSWWENLKYIRMLILIKGGITESED